MLVNVEDWLAIDSWLGAGKLADSKVAPMAEDANYSSFRAVSAAVCMSVELTEAAVAMVEKRRYYAVSAVTRQLIECEYLLTLFNEDLDYARQWYENTPKQVKAMFNPSNMRQLTGKFSNKECSNHCDIGGHPGPKGTSLLEKMDPARQSWPFAAAELSIDLGLHLHRIWMAIDGLLVKHHARYERVRSDQRGRAEGAWTAWQKADPVVAVLAEAWEIK